ncbi:MAG: SdpA family antimicrobial peptide system protein [Nannocystaceae bacterium]
MLAIYTIDASNKVTAIRLPFQDKKFTKLIFPQGWAFFTRSPHEPINTFYVRDPAGQWTLANLPPLGHVSNAFGFIRAPRRQSVESAFLVGAIEEQQWTNCRDDTIDCLDSIDRTRTMESVSPLPTLCGDVGIVQTMPIPFAWIRGRSLEHYRSFNSPSRVVRLEVQC